MGNLPAYSTTVFWRYPGCTSPAHLELARRYRLGEGSAAGMPWGTAGWASRGPHRRVHAQPYAPPRHGMHKAHETPCTGVSLGDPITCGLVSTGRRNEGGSAASFRWRRILLITAPCVMTAMSRSVPRWHNGHVAISRANTRFSSLAHVQYGVLLGISSPSRPC